MTEDGIFKELDKVIACQLQLEPPAGCQDQVLQAISEMPNDVGESASGQINPTTKIPLVDMVLNIDLFTAHFEDRSKVLRIIKELFNHCTTMKKLFLRHAKLIVPVLMFKYDKQCHLYVNIANQKGKQGKSPPNNKEKKDENVAKPQDLAGEHRDEFLAVTVGQLIRLYAKSKSMSQVFQNFGTLDRIVDLMQHEQYIIQSDAQKTFDTIFKGPRIYQNIDKRDAFISWIDNNADNQIHERLNKIFREMRQSDKYSFKRHSMKLQYEILSLGLKGSMIA